MNFFHFYQIINWLITESWGLCRIKYNFVKHDEVLSVEASFCISGWKHRYELIYMRFTSFSYNYLFIIDFNVIILVVQEHTLYIVMIIFYYYRFQCNYTGCSRTYIVIITFVFVYYRFQCDYTGCLRTYSTAGNLRTHKKTHKGIYIYMNKISLHQ